MTTISVKLDDHQVVQMLARSRLRQDPLLRTELVKIGDVVTKHVRAAAPRSAKHRGRGKPLADSFQTRSLAKSVVVRSYKPYAAIMEAGGSTPEHEIVPKKAGALALANGLVFKRVTHPGAVYQGKHYAAQTARKDAPMIAERLADAVERSFKR